jgi:hypothetical protein
VLAVWQRNRRLSALSKLEQGALRIARRARQPSGTEQVSRLKIASVDRAVRNQLSRGPVGSLRRAAAREAHRDVAGLAHTWCLQPYLEHDVDAGALAVLCAAVQS